MKNIAFPFRCLNEDCLNIASWQLHEDKKEPEVVPEYINDWDYQKDIFLSRAISVDPEKISNSLGLNTPPDSLCTIIRIGTGKGSIPRAWIDTQKHEFDISKPINISLRISGQNLSERLYIETSIIYAHVFENGDELTPSIPAALLWRDGINIRLEGDETRFPVEAVKFSAIFKGQPQEKALWYLDYSEGHPTRDFTSAVRLYVNMEQKEFYDRFYNQEDITLQILISEIMIEICKDFLSDDEYLDISDFEPGTIGGYASSWLELAFSGASLSTCKSILEATPAKFNSALQAIANPGKSI